MRNSVTVFMSIALIFLTSMYVIMLVIGYENNIERLEQTNQKQELYMDSLTCVIDSLNTELQQYDIKYQYNQLKEDLKGIIDAIIFVESSGDDSAHAIGEDAVGAFQIRKVMVDDINRILKRKGVLKTYSYKDRWCRTKSTEMFKIFCSYYKLETAEEIARCWNGGPRGINNPYTLGYWNKVENELEESYASR